MDYSPSCPSERLVAADVARGVSRLLFHQDYIPLREVPLGNGRRADIVALGGDGRITLVEIKVSAADLRGDVKWRDYLDYCDRYFWAVPAGFRLDDFAQSAFLPERTGLIVADRYGAEVLRDAPLHPLNPGRRRSEQLRFARRAARRLLAATDSGLGDSDIAI